MVVRLQTFEGYIKEYRTAYSAKGEPDPAGDSEGSPHYLDKYITNCGLEWKDKPNEHEECDHLECAIYLAKQKRKKGPEGFMFFIVIAAVSMIIAGMLMAKVGQNLTTIFLLVPHEFLNFALQRLSKKVSRNCQLQKYSHRSKIPTAWAGLPSSSWPSWEGWQDYSSQPWISWPRW